MTQKGLNFIVSGMLATEQETAARRIAFILSNLDMDTVDGFTNGFITDVDVTDTDELLEYIRKEKKSVNIDGMEKYKIKREGLTTHLVCTLKVHVYTSPNNKAWQPRKNPDENFTEKKEDVSIYSINLTEAFNSGVLVPGVSYTFI